MTFEFPERTRQPPVMRYADTQLAFEATRHRSRVSENWPALDSLVTEDYERVDNIFSEKQPRLLPNQNGQLILTGSETTEEEHQRAEQERAEKQKALELAEQERQRAEQEHQRAERFAAQLRALGIDPQSV